jgi:hypothetical protein
MKKLLKILIITFSAFFSFFINDFVLASETTKNEDNIIIDAYSQRREKLFELIN